MIADTAISSARTAAATVWRASPCATEWTFGAVEGIVKNASFSALGIEGERAEILELIGRAKALLHKS